MTELTIPYSLLVLYYFFEGIEIANSWSKEEAFLEITQKFEDNQLAVINAPNMNELENILSRGGLFKVKLTDNTQLYLKRRNGDLVFISISTKR